MPSSRARIVRSIRNHPRVVALNEILSRGLDAQHGRVLLSVLIVISILPLQGVTRFWWAFFAIFLVELIARLTVLFTRRQGLALEGRSNLFEGAILTLDLLALISFLPMQDMAFDAKYLRVFRLSRLLLLLGYWGPMVLMLWNLLMRRERRQQLWFLFLVVALVTVVSAVLLDHFARAEFSQLLGRPAHFLDVVWWAFRQIEDPGNLVQQPFSVTIVLMSLFLTVCGIFLVSFLIGVGTTIVAEMMELGRDQPLGLRNHSVMINLTRYSHFFLDEVVGYYQKQLAKPRWLLMGQDPIAPEYLSLPKFRQFIYRHGNSYHTEDLAKTDITSATRIIIQANDKAENPDAETLSTILSVRQENPDAWIIAEILSERNVTAAVRAGGLENTVIVPTDQFTALYLAKTIVFPDLQRVVKELISTVGEEVYSFIYDEALQPHPSPIADRETFSRLFQHAYQEHKILLMGIACQDPDSTKTRRFEVALNPLNETELKHHHMKGIFGISNRYQEMRKLGLEYSARGFGLGADEKPSSGEGWQLVLDYQATDELKVLIGGFDVMMVEVVEQVMQAHPGALIYFMIPGTEAIRTARNQIRETGLNLKRFENPDWYGSRARGEFIEVDEVSLGYLLPSGERAPGRVFFVNGDPSSRHQLLRKNPVGFDLFEMDKIVFVSPHRRSGDPDAGTVLALLKILNLRNHQDYRDRFKPDVHIIAGLQDVLKGELLEKRFEQDPEIASLPITIFSAERIRNYFMFQSIVVPGFDGIYREILDHWGHDLVQASLSVAPGQADRSTNFAELVLRLQREQRVILLGISLKCPGARDSEIHVNPKPGAPGFEFTLGELDSLFVILHRES